MKHCGQIRVAGFWDCDTKAYVSWDFFFLETCYPFLMAYVHSPEELSFQVDV